MLQDSEKNKSLSANIFTKIYNLTDGNKDTHVPDTGVSGAGVLSYLAFVLV